jgi:hypothetical protein
VKSSLQERGKSAHIDPMLLDFGEEMLRKWRKWREAPSRQFLDPRMLCKARLHLLHNRTKTMTSSIGYLNGPSTLTKITGLRSVGVIDWIAAWRNIWEAIQLK